MTDSTNPRPAFMASLTGFCKSLDRQVADLERETKTAVMITNRGPYASNAADQLREEAVALSKDIENSLATVVEEKNNMASFLDEMKVQFGEIVTEQLKMEKFMTQYGYKAKTQVTIEELLNWEPQIQSVTPAAAAEFTEELIEDVEEPDLSLSETDTVKSVAEVKPTSKSPHYQKKPLVNCDSPNFFEVGLSSLAMELYVGKSTQSKKYLKPQEVNPESSNSASMISEDNTFSASPVLRLSSKLTEQPDLSNMSSMSSTDSIDITPGLPSRKKASIPVPSMNDAPNLSVLYQQQSSTASPDLASVRSSQATPRHQRLPPASSDTPKLPELETVDIRKLLTESSLPAHANTNTKDYTPEEPQLTCKYINKVHSSNQNTDTPEEPQLTSQYLPSTHTITGRSTPDLPTISSSLPKSPETPVLSFHSWK